MDSLPLLLLIFVLGLATLVKASDFFTDAAEKLGLAMGLPPFIVGVTIVSMGTSLPELLSSLFGIFQGAAEVVASNVIGSNIANICLVVGTAAIMSTKILRVMYNLISVDLPLFVGSAFLFSLMASSDQTFTRGEALILVIGYIVYLFYILKSSDEATDDSNQEAVDPSAPAFTTAQLMREVLILVLSGIFIFLGANYTIDSLIQISDRLNIGRDIIAISAVALGTSLPELMVTINAALKGKAELAVGNVIGSNIFNIFVVVGIPGLIRPLPVSDAILTHSVPTLLAASLLMFFIVQDNKITIWEGWLFIMLYIWFMGTTFQVI
ncbi:sodium:calcium antiporter [Leptolyngbyaceae cyanobacterium CCMR0082]|uniref:Sodium:calcium antiporter n=2 Tax=Adonisia turfae TaxID=2950184 RepID=A0A6M0SGS0_9CYAN|nr:calcium/sodium antiporter [Adonisia turfae]MDV3350657.1 calcium/sodium antiporter [Leptothoe sp. LEGE 181152]NEZ60263.1 sodium:calcium antiporter [Adonisia turfae CCMR0081]NEZ67778.1 sodium:calcium antiporter [Adonisia turfae CCMR0082]